MRGVSQHANPEVETLKFITQTTNYEDNEPSLIAERITFLPLKRFQQQRASPESWNENTSAGRLRLNRLHSTTNSLRITYPCRGWGIISKSDSDH